MACKGGNDADSLPKLRRFLEIAVEYKPVNLGDARHGGALRPSKDMNPAAHWNRNITPDFQAVIEGLISRQRALRYLITRLLQKTL